MGGPLTDEAHNIKVDSNGYIYNTGYFYGTADFNPGSATYYLTSDSGTADVFITKLNPVGGFVFARRIGGSDDDRGRALTLETDGSIAVTGHFSKTVDFDPGPGAQIRTSLGWTDIFLLRLSTIGNYASVMALGSGSMDMGRAITRDQGNHLYLTGFFKLSMTVDLGNAVSTLNSNGNKDLFLIKK